MNVKAKKGAVRLLSPDPLDYPCTVSGYEKESLVAEAILAAKKKIGRPNPSKNRAAVEKAIAQNPSRIGY